jgi:hypothetical protein
MKTHKPFLDHLALEPTPVSLQFILLPETLIQLSHRPSAQSAIMRDFRRATFIARIGFIFKSVPHVPLLILQSTFRLILRFRILICLKKFEYNSIPVDLFPCFDLFHCCPSVLNLSLQIGSVLAIFLRTFDFGGAAARAPFELHR